MGQIFVRANIQTRLLYVTVKERFCIPYISPDFSSNLPKLSFYLSLNEATAPDDVILCRIIFLPKGIPALLLEKMQREGANKMFFPRYHAHKTLGRAKGVQRKRITFHFETIGKTIEIKNNRMPTASRYLCTVSLAVLFGR